MTYKKKFSLVIGSILFLLLFLLYGFSAFKEQQVKAYFIYNFTKFIEWPNLNKSNTFIIGILGKSGLVQYLNEIAAENRIKDLKVKIMQFGKAEKINYSHILIVPENHSKALSNILNKNDMKNTLIICEKKNRHCKIAGISFLLKKKMVKFEINLAGIKKNGLKVSSKLLKLAVNVY